MFGSWTIKSTNNFSMPRLADEIREDKIGQIASGWNHSLALSSTGTLYAKGLNDYGQLGMGDTDFKKDFT